MLPQIAVGLLTASFIIGTIYKPLVLFPEAKVSFLDLSIIFITAFTWLAKRNSLKIYIFKYWPLVKPITIFFAVGFVSLIPSVFRFGPTATLIGSFYLFRWLIYSSFFLVLLSLFGRYQLICLSRILLYSLLLTGIVQYLFWPDIRPLSALGWDPHYYRVVGSLLDPGFYGLLLTLFIIWIPFLFTVYRLQYIFWFLTYLLMAFTYSRSSFVSFLSSSAFLSWRHKSAGYFMAAVFLTAATLVYLPRAANGEGVKLERTNSIISRFHNWGQSLFIFYRNPILGVGFNTYRYARWEYGFSFTDPVKWKLSHSEAGADSSILFVAATTGVIGLALYLNYLYKLWQISVSLPFRSTLVAIFFHSFFLNSLFYPYSMLLIALYLSLTLTTSKD